MPIDLRDLDALDADAVQQNIDEMTARIREDNPTLYLKQGPFFSLLAYYHALFSTRDQANLQDYLNARSLYAMSLDPTIAPPELVDEAASNFNVVRLPGSTARGSVTVVVADDISVVIGVGAVFEADGKRFVTEQSFSAKLEAEQVTLPGDRILLKQPDGNWAFVIEVVAEAEGESYALKKDTVIVPLVAPNRYVTSYVTSDFLDGRSSQSNSELVVRLQTGISAKTIGGPINNLALLLAQPEFERITQLSCIGLGNAELTRDRPTIFPIKLGGRSDWYVRTQEEIVYEAVSAAATLIEKRVDGTGIWQMTFDRATSAGVFEIAKIRPAGSEDGGGFEIVEDIRGIDLDGDGFLPDVSTAPHVAYSAYQTITVRFHDDQTDVGPLTLGDVVDYDCERRLVPLIAEIQDFVNKYEVRSLGSDCLVKAPVPCFVSLHITITKQSGTADPDTDSMKNALVRLINGIGYVGRLYASQVGDVVHGYLDGAVGVSALDLHGRLRYPDGELRYLRDRIVLTVPADEERMVSPRTVQFFATVDDISIAVETNVPLNP